MAAPTSPLRTHHLVPQTTTGLRHEPRVVPHLLRNLTSLQVTRGTQWLFWDLGSTRKARSRSRLLGTKTMMRTMSKPRDMTDCLKLNWRDLWSQAANQGWKRTMEGIRDPTEMGIKLTRRKSETLAKLSAQQTGRNKIQMLSKSIIYTLSVAVCNTDETAKNKNIQRMNKCCVQLES